MSTNHEQDNLRGLEEAVAERLRRSMNEPDTTGLEQRVLGELDAAVGQCVTSAGWQFPWRSALSTAAAVLIVALLGWLLLFGTVQKAVADPVTLADIHGEVETGTAPHMRVASIAEANRLLASEYRSAVMLPELPGALHSCCLHDLDAVTMSCALIEWEGNVITVAIAAGDRIEIPAGEAVVSGDGQTWISHQVDSVNMVMRMDEENWVCVMGHAPTDVLLDYTARITWPLTHRQR